MKSFSRFAKASLCVFTLLYLQVQADAALIFGPSPYLSEADIPNNFYVGGIPTSLENFEDGNLSFGVLASAGIAILPAGNTDSVDGDDGSIDGSGTNGRSWFSNNGPAGVTFTFTGTLPSAAGMVWTDGSGTTTFEAFGPGMISLGTVSGLLADGGTSGTTVEDRFFGVQDSNGILAIKLSNTSGGIEVDHVQFGVAAIPEPSSCLLLCSSISLLTAYRNRRRRID